MKTINLNLGTEKFFWVAVSLGLLFLFGQNGIAQEATFDPARNHLTPTVSLESISDADPKADTKSDSQPDPLNLTISPLSPPSDKGGLSEDLKDIDQNLNDLWSRLNLSDAQKNELASTMGDMIRAIQDFKDTRNYSDSASIDAFIESRSLNSYEFRNDMNALVVFLGKHPTEKPAITKTVVVVLNYVFDRLEKKTAEVKKESDQTKTNLELFGDLLKEDADLLSVAKKSTSTVASEKNAPISEKTLENTQKTQETMDDVLEILRREAVNDRAPALRREMYRNCYLKLAKRVRFNHLYRIRMLTEQKRAEEFKLPFSYS